MNDLTVFFFQGGVSSIPLTICSILSIALTLDRVFNLRRSKIIREDLLVDIEDAVNDNRFNEVLKITATEEGPMMRVARVAILNSKTGRDNLKNAIEEAGRLEIPFLEKNLTALNTIVVIAPLFGLLGTVTGMIRVFGATVGEVSANIDTLAAGISEALISTAFGLVVALPTLIAHSYFARKVELLTNEMEKNSLTLFNIVVKNLYSVAK